VTAGPDPSLPAVLPPPRIACASWLDPALIASGRFYPRRTMTAEERLRWYASVFDCVEVNATYYAIPAPRTVAGWVERTPPGFVFHVKAYGLLTGHHPRPESLPAPARVLMPETLPLDRHGGVALPRVPAEARQVTLELFRETLAPLAAAGKLGYVLFQLAPWVAFGDGVLRYLESLPASLPGWPVAVEFRHPSFIPQRTAEVLGFLAARGLTLAALDAPWQPYVDGVTTPGLALLRCHGRNIQGWRDQMAGRDPSVAEKYDYLYGPGEIDELATRARALQARARQVAVTFNNNNEDFPVQNALDLRRLLGLETPDLQALRAAWRPSRPPARGRAGGPDGGSAPGRR
jgi:uncharacterized protein YecE (DUF72 family)